MQLARGLKAVLQQYDAHKLQQYDAHNRIIERNAEARGCSACSAANMHWESQPPVSRIPQAKRRTCIQATADRGFYTLIHKGLARSKCACAMLGLHA